MNQTKIPIMQPFLSVGIYWGYQRGEQLTVWEALLQGLSRDRAVQQGVSLTPWQAGFQYLVPKWAILHSGPLVQQPCWHLCNVLTWRAAYKKVVLKCNWRHHLACTTFITGNNRRLLPTNLANQVKRILLESSVEQK